MARKFNGSSDNGVNLNVDLSGTNKITIYFRYKTAAFENDDGLLMEHTPSTSGNNGFFVNPNESANGKFDVALFGNVGWSIGRFDRPSAGVYHSYICLLDKGKASNEIDAVYVDGVSQSLTFPSGLNNNNTNNFASDELNIMSRNQSSLFCQDDLAELAIFPSLLNVNQRAKLDAGISPNKLGIPTAVYYTMQNPGSTEADLSGNGNNLSMTGTTPAAHPFLTESVKKIIRSPFYTLLSDVVAVTKIFTIDAVIKTNDITKTFTIDSVIQKLNFTKTFTIDAIIQAANQLKTFTLDAVVQKLDSLKTFTIDTIIQKLDFTKTFTVDVVIDPAVGGGGTKTFTIDSVIQKLDVLKTFTVDSVIQKLDFTTTFTIDTHIIRQITQIFTIDAVIKTLGKLKTFTVDAVIQLAGVIPPSTTIFNLFLSQKTANLFLSKKQHNLNLK